MNLHPCVPGNAVVRQIACQAFSPITFVFQNLFASGYPSRGATLRSLVLCLVIISAITTQAQDEDPAIRLGPFELQPRTANPLREPFNSNTQSTPVAVDLD